MSGPALQHTPCLLNSVVMTFRSTLNGEFGNISSKNVCKHSSEQWSSCLEYFKFRVLRSLLPWTVSWFVNEGKSTGGVTEHRHIEKICLNVSSTCNFGQKTDQLSIERHYLADDLHSISFYVEAESKSIVREYENLPLYFTIRIH